MSWLLPVTFVCVCVLVLAQPWLERVAGRDRW